MHRGGLVGLYILGFVLALLLSPHLVLCQQSHSSSGEVLTLEQALALALSHNRLVKNTELEVEKAEEQLAAVRTKQWPILNLDVLGSQQLQKIDFTFEQGVFGTFPGIGPIPETDTTLTTPLRPTAIVVGRVSQPLSQLYRIRLTLEQLKLSGEIARQQSQTKQQEIARDVKKVYYGILQTQSAMQTLEETIQLYRELDRITGEYVQQRVALKSEGLEVKTRLAKAEYDVMTTNDQLAAQKEQLNLLLGRDVLTEFSLSPVPDATGVEADLAAARAQAQMQRPELREAQLKIKQAEFDRRAKKAEYIPDVSLSFQYATLQNFNDFLPKQIASVGFTVSWEIFDWGRKKRELAEKTLTLKQAENGLQETEAMILIDVNDKFRKLQQTRQLLRIARLTQDTAIEQARVMVNRYQQQASLMKDVLQAQTSVEQANYQYQQAVLAFWTAKAEFEKAVGEN